jgi:AAA domain, putative AbiEii toxin, Type IV TA system
LKVILIDEPDAFLHPPLARRLGGTLTTLASERNGNVVASTHDSNFLMGCVQAGKPVNIVRLTYRGGVATARLLEADRLRSMMRDPLLRSTRVMDALFHQGALVCESDPDRAFYQEINDRLLAENHVAAADCIFLNAQNKQTIRRIIRPLRDMGIPAAAVVDLDIITKNKHNDLRDLMEAAYVPNGLVKSLGQMRGEVEAAFSAKTLSPKRAGINSLDQSQRETAEVLLRDLCEYGVFLLPVGELEQWLSFLGVPSDNPEQKRDWLPTVFDRMGNDPDTTGYLKPGSDDVWAFIQRIAGWVADPARKGMPE